MKIARGKIDAFLRQPGDDVLTALIYGPDRGLCRERSEQLATAVCPDLNDPFRVAHIGEDELKSDPRRLSDELSAIAMTGGRRVVIVDADSDSAGKIVAGVAEEADWDSLLIVVAGNLTPRSTLRKSMEASPSAAVVACYADDDVSLGQLVDQVLGAWEVKADREVREFVADNLGGDRLASRSELEKLALYAGKGGTLSLEEVTEALGDSSALAIDDLVYAASAGDFSRLENLLRRARDDCLAPISILRAVQRHLQRLQVVRDQMDRGRPVAEAMKGLRPPVMFMFADRFRSQVNAWSGTRLAQAMELVVEAELDCKSTGMPAEAVCERAMLRIAHAAGHGRSA